MAQTYPYALSLIAKTSIYGRTCFCGIVAGCSDPAADSGKPVQASASGGALAGTDPVAALPPLFHGRCALGCRATAHPHGDPSDGRPDQYWPERGYSAAVFVARGRMDQPGLRWIAGRAFLDHGVSLPSPAALNRRRADNQPRLCGGIDTNLCKCCHLCRNICEHRLLFSTGIRVANKSNHSTNSDDLGADFLRFTYSKGS